MAVVGWDVGFRFPQPFQAASAADFTMAHQWRSVASCALLRVALIREAPCDRRGDGIPARLASVWVLVRVATGFCVLDGMEHSMDGCWTPCQGVGLASSWLVVERSSPVREDRRSSQMTVASRVTRQCDWRTTQQTLTPVFLNTPSRPTFATYMLWRENAPGIRPSHRRSLGAWAYSTR